MQFKQFKLPKSGYIPHILSYPYTDIYTDIYVSDVHMYYIVCTIYIYDICIYDHIGSMAALYEIARYRSENKKWVCISVSLSPI